MRNPNCTIISALILTISFLSKADAHGYVTTPRSRQWVAAEDGVWSGGAPTLPAKENCPSCANTKNADGFCGIVDNRDYDNPLDQSGNPMIPQAQSVYTEGQIIDMEFIFTANHNGHHVTYACPNLENPTKECFEQYPLEFIEDISMETYGTDANAPKDPNYPERGYVNPGASHTKMRFKLPEGLTGDLVLLQWHWVTGNSCRSAGYDSYPYPPGWEPANMGPCPDRENLDPVGVGQPEQFWNCMEVKIVADGEPTSPPPPPSPTPPSPTPPSPTPPSPTPPSPTPPPPTGNGCCSQNYQTCDATWCGATEELCLSCGSPGDKTWLPNGAVDNCIARFGDCTNDTNGCCGPAICVGNEWYRQCLPDPNAPPPSPTPPSPTPPSPTPLPTPSPTLSPTPPFPTTPSPTYSPSTLSPVVPGSNALFSTSTTRSSYEALRELDTLTNIVQASNPPIYALVAEGGAAGNGNVVSEGQAYAVMIAGITLAAVDLSDPNRQDTMDRFYGYFNGWKRMCEISTSKAFCQDQKFCGGGTTACLPGWKHDKDLTEVLGTGAAPDGDQDAIVGMIMAVKAVENDAQKPSWYDEVRVWADASSTAFQYYNTKSSKTGNAHRIVKLGSCWGGWETEGQNPSYHSPGSYRLMKNYQKEFPVADRDYTVPNFQDGMTTETRWNKVIKTSYEFLDASQCEDMGLVPNWAMATETLSGDINLYPGSFSGSGTPQYEFGSEASRTMWRVLFDVAIYPNEAFEDAEHFLSPVHSRLNQGFTGNNWVDNTLMPCAGVHNVFSNWRFNAFIYSPVYSTLVLKAGGVDTITQQNMVDAAGTLVDNIPSGLSYYSRSWSVIGILTLNGDVTKAAINTGISGPVPSPPPSPQPTPSPTAQNTSNPTIQNTPSPTSPSTAPPTRTPSLRPTSASTSNDDDDLQEQLETLNQLLAALLPLINALLSLLGGLSRSFGF